MRNVCLVTNYNYSRYLQASLSSVLSQTRKFDLVIVVDDGSLDDSREIIGRFCSEYREVVSIHKANGGQLSCFHSALSLIEADDLVFFLDADDVYPHDYLEQVSGILAGNRAEFVFVKPVEFADGAPLLTSSCIAPQKSFAFSSTSALTRKMHCWIGAATSCIAMRGALCHALLPYPFEKDWVTRADDVLIYGASITGARKLYIDSLGVNYRIHGQNSFSGRRITSQEKTDWRLRHERLLAWYSEKGGVPRRPPLKNTVHETAEIPKWVRKALGIPSPLTVCIFDLLLGASTMRVMLKDLVGCRQT